MNILYVSSRCSSFPTHSKDMQHRSFVDTKFSIGVNVSVNVCVWALPVAQEAGLGSSPPQPYKNKAIMDGYIMNP